MQFEASGAFFAFEMGISAFRIQDKNLVPGWRAKDVAKDRPLSLLCMEDALFTFLSVQIPRARDGI